MGARTELEQGKQQGPADSMRKPLMNQVMKENQETVPAKGENLDGYVAQYCGSAAPGQGFFYIEDHQASRTLRTLLH